MKANALRKPAAHTSKKPAREQDARSALQALAEVLAPLVAEILGKQAASERIKHTESPLGKRRTLRLIRTGHLPAEKVGRLYLIRREDLEAFLASRRAVLHAVGGRAEEKADVLAELKAAGWS